MGLSLQRMGPGRVWLPVQVPSRKPLLLSKLTLAPAIRSYSATAFFTASMFRWWDTKTLISPNAETLAVREPAKGIQRRTGFAPSSLSLRTRDSKAKTQKRGDGGGQPYRTDRSIANALEHLLFTCTTACRL